MKNKIWLVPFLIVISNALAVVVRWSSMPEQLPAHYDLQGNAGGTMSRNILLLYILIGAFISLLAYIIGRKKNKLQLSMAVLASGICLVLFSSTMVTLTSGTMPILMLAEPVILLAAVIASIVSAVKS